MRRLAVGRRVSAAGSEGSAVAEERLDVDSETTPLEPRAHRAHVPLEELEALRVAEDVDDLGPVDDDELVVADEDVVGREVAVRPP